MGRARRLLSPLALLALLLGPVVAAQPQAAPAPARGARVLPPDGSPWASPAACEASLRARPPRRKARTSLRVASWNLGWFPDGAARKQDPERARDPAWLACALALLDVDVLAAQELVQHPRGRAALLELQRQLDARTGGRFEAEVDACPGDGRQHVALLYDRTRVTARGATTLREQNPGRSACDRRLRPGLLAALHTKHHELAVMTVHWDSGQLERDYLNRRTSAAALDDALRSGNAPDATLVLGDLNTMGCKGCAPAVSAEQELAALDAELSRLSPPLSRVRSKRPCSMYYRGRGALLDHALASPALLSKHAVTVSVEGACAALSCERIPRVAPVPAFAHLSDHCPIVVDIR